ncbi:thioesterase family protein [Patulibacter sp. SYSU D01012]|uniref:thioesterase family protein n=1 Tax=Patulibacter sp. SYSU D01012 TaxID=2817381 RepID=UPI001B301E50|nr:thioesterase family protein [Patulibacter sp. SYSU D01012]
MSAEALAVVTAQDGDVVRLELGDVARGPWDAASAHGGAPAALLTRAVEAHAAGTDLRVSSLAFTFLGPVPLGAVEIRTTVRKSGRRLQVVHGELRAGGRTAMEVQATLLRRGRVPLPAGVGMPWPELAPPEGRAAAPAWFVVDGGRAFHPDAVEIRPLGDAPLGEPTPDGAAAWLRLRVPVVGEETPTAAQRAAAAADFGNGLSCPVPMADYVFVNCDLHVALHRDPAGEWIGLRARTELDRAGTGLTTTELHDAAGRFGTATQTLFVEARA